MKSFGLIALGLAASFALPAVPAAAQQVYRSIGPDGRTVFTDMPPSEAAARAGGSSSATSASNASMPTSLLPFALRQVAERFPVVLYSGPQCLPCDQGRALLSTRGIPFAERTVSTEQDAQALQRLSSERSLPLLTIGGQHLKGFSGSEWNQYLDAAGYPKTSSLPANWKAPAPQALAPRTAPVAAAPANPNPNPASNAETGGGTSAPVAAPRGSAPAPASSGRNPSGIQF